MLCHGIGCIINEHKSWGNKFIDNPATEYMAKFAAVYEDEEFVQTASAQIPWSHNTDSDFIA